jgi:hypothetical protein
MLTRTEIKEIVEQVKIQDGWRLLLLEDQVYQTQQVGRLYLQIQFDDVDNVTGNPNYVAHCRKWYLSEHMTKQEIVRTAWLAYQGAVLHEAAEKFLYKGRMIYGPHYDVDVLWEGATQVQHRPGEH